MPTPNLYVATQKLLKPQRWFASSSNPSKKRSEIEHRNSPVAGTYEYRPGRGWYLIATDHPAETLSTPIHVKYSRVLRRNLLEPDYAARKKHGKVRGKDGKLRDLGFFRLDDGVAWVNYLDEEGRFLPGPYKMWCIDKESGNFRPMLKGDDPAWQNRRSGQSTPTAAMSTASHRSEEGTCQTCRKSTPSITASESVSRPRTPMRSYDSSQTSFVGSLSDANTSQASIRDADASVVGSDTTAPSSIYSYPGGGPCSRTVSAPS
jgi:hypothetical protein